MRHVHVRADGVPRICSRWSCAVLDRDNLLKAASLLAPVPLVTSAAATGWRAGALVAITVAWIGAVLLGLRLRPARRPVCTARGPSLRAAGRVGRWS